MFSFCKAFTHRFFFIALALTLVACSQMPAPITNKHFASGKTPIPSHKPSASSNTVTVQPGNSLFEIARTYNVDMKELAKANGLESPYTIKAGQQLRLPQQGTYLAKNNSTDKPVAGADFVHMPASRIVGSPSAISEEPLAPLAGQGNQSAASASTATIDTTELKIPEIVMEGPSQSAPIATDSTQPITTAEPIPGLPQASGNFANKETSGSSVETFIWPVAGPVISRFGPKEGGMYNDGINIEAKEGTPVRAAAEGTVVYAGNELKGYGNLLIIQHPNGYLTAYAHNRNIVLVKGEQVRQGQIIGYVGKTGNVVSPQLHFGMRKGRDAVNPEDYLTSKLSNVD